MMEAEILHLLATTLANAFFVWLFSRLQDAAILTFLRAFFVAILGATSLFIWFGVFFLFGDYTDNWRGSFGDIIGFGVLLIPMAVQVFAIRRLSNASMLLALFIVVICVFLTILAFFGAGYVLSWFFPSPPS
jgi:hypothetical protein